MAYSGWRFSCDRGTLERCAGALEIQSKEAYSRGSEHASSYLNGAAAALRCIIADGEGIDPAEFAAQVMARAGVEL